MDAQTSEGEVVSKPDWVPFENNYVLVSEFDSDDESAAKYKSRKRGPIVMETYLDTATTLRRAFEHATSGYRPKYGRCTIARLVFEDFPLDMLMEELTRLDEPTPPEVPF